MDRLDSATSPQLSATQAQPGAIGEEDDSMEVLEKIGGPGRTRTYNQRIMSPRL